MRIVFDGTTLTLGTWVSGLPSTCCSICPRSRQHRHEPVVVSNQPIDTPVPPPPHVRLHDGHRLIASAGAVARARRGAAAGRRPLHERDDLIGSPVATVVTVHDMSLRLYPQCHPVRRLLLNRPLMHLAIRRASSIVTVSNSARRDLLRLHGVAPDRVAVVHEAASPAFRPIADRPWLEDVRARHALPRQFMLYVGTIEPRKNLSRLMSAFADARKAGIPHHLVCVGPYGWSSRDLAGHIERLGIQDVVHFTGYVPFEDLPAIYNLGEFFAFPSLYEGFGLPVVEAMACGIPVLTSTTSSLGEIAGDAAETIDPTDTDAIADAIVRLATDADLRRDRAERGLQRARSFSWAQTARDMLAVYQRAAGVTLKRRRDARRSGRSARASEIDVESRLS